MLQRPQRAHVYQHFNELPDGYWHNPYCTSQRVTKTQKRCRCENTSLHKKQSRLTLSLAFQATLSLEKAGNLPLSILSSLYTLFQHHTLTSHGEHTHPVISSYPVMGFLLFNSTRETGLKPRCLSPGGHCSHLKSSAHSHASHLPLPVIEKATSRFKLAQGSSTDEKK